MARCRICSEKFTPKYRTTEQCCYKSECITEYLKVLSDNAKAKRESSKTSDLKLKKVYSIPKVSKKRKDANKEYEKIRIQVLSEARFKCFIEGCDKTATTVEHLMGRKGYADNEARENNIPLLIDKRYLRACCMFHNGELERNPELSKRYQYSKISGIKKSEL